MPRTQEPPAMSPFRLALWSENMARPCASLEAWLDDVGARMADAKAAGAALLLTPEYWVERWLGFKPEGLRTDQEIDWMAARAPEAVAGLTRLVARHGIGLVAGSMPWAEDGRNVNRAWTLLPDGRALAQDKLFLTPFEKAPDAWLLAPGREIVVFEYAGHRMAVLICLDIEVPAFSVALAAAAPDLVLVPSMTSYVSGYSRVFGCAKARAVELMAAVAVTGCIGAAPGTTYNDTNVSGCAAYLPCEIALGSTCVALERPAVGAIEGIGYFELVDLPLAEIRAIRRDGAEVWPGVQTGDGIATRLA